EKASAHEYILLPFMPSSTQSTKDKDANEVPYKGDDGVSKGSGIDDQDKTDSSTQDVGTTKPSINTASTNINTGSLNINTIGPNDPSMPYLEETSIFDDVYDDRKVGAEAVGSSVERVGSVKVAGRRGLQAWRETVEQYFECHRVIPFAHFINNDLEYLRGGASSRMYTTSVTKTKAADYGHIKWIEDLVPRTMWIQEPIDYGKHALYRVSHWGRKHQQFYGFAVNQEFARDVYSKRRIIAVTELKIVK
nr:hypothetical protein [Tanacetum cinerariifolium]GFA47721.1 hypothetical protein [Tanacetum cinerariifolium]